jgi:hypothetical protein
MQGSSSPPADTWSDINVLFLINPQRKERMHYLTTWMMHSNNSGSSAYEALYASFM